MSGQGDSNVVSKDDDSEITSTTDNGGAPVSDLPSTKTVCGGVSADVDSTEATVASKSPDDSIEAAASIEKDPSEEQPPKGEDLSEAINDNVEADGTIDLNVTIDAGNIPSKEAQVCGDTMISSSKDEVTHLECSKDTEPGSSKDSNVDADKDSCSISEELELKWDEEDDDIDDTILTADEPDLVNNELNTTFDADPTLILEPDLVTDKLDIDKNKTSTVELSSQLVEEMSSDNKDDCNNEEISSSIDENNQIDKEIASTSFESQDIIDKIDNITQDQEIASGIHAEPIHLIETAIPDQEMDIDDSGITAEPIHLIETGIPDQGMDVDATTIDPSIDNVTVEVETKLLMSPKEEEMDVETVIEAPLKTIDSNDKDLEKSSEIEVVKEADIKVESVDIQDEQKSDVESKILTKDKDSEKSSEMEAVKEVDIKIESVDKQDEQKSDVDGKILTKDKDSENTFEIESVKEVDIKVESIDKQDEKMFVESKILTKDKDSEKSSEIEAVKEADIKVESGDKQDEQKCDVESKIESKTPEIEGVKEADINLESGDKIDEKISDLESKILTKDKSEKSSEIETVKEADINIESGDKIDEQKCVDESILTEDSHDSKLGTMTPNVHHRINKPNVMLDIPTNIDLLQELSDIEADMDDDLDFEANSVDKTDGVKTVENSQKSDVIDLDMQEEEKHDDIIQNAVNTITSPTIEIDATSSKLNIKTVSLTEKLLATEELPKTKSSDDSNIELIEEDKPKAEVLDEANITEINEQSSLMKELLKSEKIEPNDDKPKPDIDDEKPSTSKAVLETMIPDNDSVQEVSDSLGLLAESSRVMDDDNDDDVEDDVDHDDDDIDDEDFDPYEETNSDLAEDMDSRTPPPESLPKLAVLDKQGRDSDEDTMEIPSTMDIVDDIECVENDLPGLDNTVPDEDDVIIMKTDEVIDADLHIAKKGSPPDKIINILEKVLGPQISTSVKGKDPTVASNVRNYVEVEGSSESDDETKSRKGLPKGKTAASKIEELIQGVSEPESKVSVLKLDEVTIKTATALAPLQIPEITGKLIDTLKRDEVFSLDSDDDDEKKTKKEVKTDEMETESKTEVEDEVLKPESPKTEIKDESPKHPPEEPPKSEKKCINPSCTSGTQTYYPVDRTTAAYYSLNRRRAFVCDPCRQVASERSEALIEGIKELCPLLELDMDAPSQQLVEISDSDSDGEGGDDTDLIGERGARFLEEHLADIINETWQKYKLESRLKDSEACMLDEINKMEADAKEINAMLDKCQKKTDKIRFDFYKDYEARIKNVGAIVIHDTPFSSYSHTERDVEQVQSSSSRYPKRRAASIAAETPSKKQALPTGSTSLGGDKRAGDRWKTEDDKEDISVVRLSAEAAPADLPPPGEIVRPPLIAGMTILAMRNAFGTWLKGKIMDVQLKPPGQSFTQCRVKFEHKVKNPCKTLAGRCLAYPEPSKVRLTIGTRVVALFKDPHNTTRREALYGGVIAEVPNPVNSYRYLVFFDDGYAQYVHHQDTRIVCESSHLVWDEVHPFIRDFIYKYLLSYPERPMVRLHAGEKLKTEWNGKWWDSKVLKVDASIALIHFDEDNRTEWIYRGSTRLAPLYLELQAAKAGEGKGRSRLPRSKAQMRSNMPCVEYTRSDEQATTRVPTETQQQNEELRRQRAVAKKSTTPSIMPPTITPGANLEGLSRVVYYTPKNAVKPYKMVPHTCTINCRRTDLLTMKDLRTYNPLAKPLLSGWERQSVRYKALREVVYRAPCGRRLRNMPELHKYLRIIQSDMSVDMFDFTPGTHCLAEFVLNKCNVSKKDLSHGKENVPVPCVNYYDACLPEFCSYNTERTPTAGVPLNLDPEFLCGCDCTDDCQDKTKCACWKMTLEGARTIGLDGPNVGYVYRRLPEPLPSGIYECNSRCKCKQTCLNRVAQHPLQLKLQVFKTSNRGWGIRALNDVPKGSFLCVYAGNLLTDATANLDGLNEGDEYLAELDYIEVVEAMKEGYEDDVPDEDKKLDKKDSTESESEPSSESEDDKDRTEDGDFQPGFIGHPVEFKKSLRKREKAKKKEEKKQEEAQNKKDETKKKDDCITISDDEEVREPSRFTAEDGMVDKDLITKQSSRVSVRTLFGKDEACYIMDAKVQGNIGRYLNHSCHPNVFVQNVFVDTHDPRFPWVAFFALSHVRAGTELTWNYNYDVGSVPEKVLYCYCGAPNCRGRLL